MAPLSTSPEDDSPGDSESDAGSEFQMGADFLADEADETDEDLEELRLSNIEDLKPKNPPKHPLQVDQIPDSAKVISSEQPSPWMDIEHSSDTN